MSGYTECHLHGYYDNDNGCPECQDAEESRIRLDERERCIQALLLIEADGLVAFSGGDGWFMEKQLRVVLTPPDKETT